MSAWLGVSPLIGAGSLDGFATGALASGACFLAIAAPRRTRKRRALALGKDAAFGSGSDDGWLCEHVMAAEAFPAEAERLVEPDVPDGDPDAGAKMGAAGWAAQVGDVCDGFGRAAPEGGVRDGFGRAAPVGEACDGLGRAFPVSRGGRTSGSYRSRHRRLSGSSPASWASPASPASLAASTPKRRSGSLSALRKAAWPENRFRAGTSRHAAFPDSAPDDDNLRDDAHRMPDLAFPDGTLGGSRRPDVRALPRHAAPGISLSSRLGAGLGTVITSLSATRAMLGGAHG